MPMRRCCPDLIVVNRLDRENSDFYSVVNAIRQRFSSHAVPVQLPLGREHGFMGAINLLSGKAYTAAGGKPQETAIPQEMAADVAEHRDSLIEAIAETDDDLVNKYLEGEEIGEEELRAALRKAVAARQIFPILCCAGAANINVPFLLDAMVDLLPEPSAARANRGGWRRAGGWALRPWFSRQWRILLASLPCFVSLRARLSRIAMSITLHATMTNASVSCSCCAASLRRPLRNWQPATLARRSSYRIPSPATPSPRVRNRGNSSPPVYPMPSFTAAIDARTRADLDKLGAALTRLTPGGSNATGIARSAHRANDP